MKINPGVGIIFTFRRAYICKWSELYVQFIIEVLFYDSLTFDSTINLYAGLYNQMRKQGTPIATHDFWIAALAIQHNAHLCSRGHHFDHLPQLLRC
jgi:predicted nucleic acid-binding protein